MEDDILSIIFSDIDQREEAAQQAVRSELERLELRRTKVGLGAVDEAEYQRLKGLKSATGAGTYFDPLFAGVRASFAIDNGDLRPVTIEHVDGRVRIVDPTDTTATYAPPAEKAQAEGAPEKAAAKKAAAPKADPEVVRNRLVRVALVLGLLQREGVPLAPLKKGKKGTEPDRAHRNWAAFSEAFYRALGKVQANIDLARKVLPILAAEGDQPADSIRPIVSTLEFARVMGKLIERGVKASEPQLRRRVNESLDQVQDVGEDRPMHELGIVLPDLDAAANYTIVEDHIRLAGPMIFASMFEELKAFEAVDTMIDMSQRGMLNLGRGPAGTKLYEYWRNAPNRMSSSERQNFYAITLGIPGGAVDGMVNTDFQDLWLRFVSSVSSLIRENRVDQLLRSSLPVSVNQQQVKKAARDLATNLSMHGYGMSFYAAVDLQNQIQEMIDLLSDEQMRAQFGAHDMWGVLDYVAQSYLGGARNSSKYRTLATCGAIITTWLADHVSRLRDPTAPMIDLKEVENPPARALGESATSKPTDYDLVNACELWLADMAASDQRIEEMSQPREAPTGPSRPIQIPSVAQDLLDQAGIGLGMSAQPNGNRPRGNGGGGGGYVGY
ncbi:MAG TPA: hypothetical protein VIT45_08775 [Allosphingosinicella sp.]